MIYDVFLILQTIAKPGETPDFFGVKTFSIISSSENEVFDSEIKKFAKEEGFKIDIIYEDTQKITKRLNKGEKFGLEKGRAEGRTEQLVESIKNLISSGFDFDKAVEVLKIPADQIMELRRLVFES